MFHALLRSGIAIIVVFQQQLLLFFINSYYFPATVSDEPKLKGSGAPAAAGKGMVCAWKRMKRRSGVGASWAACSLHLHLL